MVSITWLVIAILISAVLGGVAGYYITRKTIVSYMEKNPPIDEATVRAMYMQMGVTPSQKKINQVISATKTAANKSAKNKKNKNKKK